MSLKVLVTYREPTEETLQGLGTEIWPLDKDGMNIGIKKILQSLEITPILVKPFGTNKEPVKDEDQPNYEGEGLYKYFSQEDIEYAKRLVRDNDGLVLPGGLMTTLNEQLLVRLFSEERKPILGICAGQNVVNKALGGTVTTVKNPEIHNQPELHNAHNVYRVPKIVYNDFLSNRLLTYANSIHETIIGKIAPGLKLIYYDRDKNPEIVGELKEETIETLKISYYSKFILTSRMHPESAVLHRQSDSFSIFSLGLFQEFKKACEDGFYIYINKNENGYIPDKSEFEKAENLHVYIEILKFLYFNSQSRDEFFERRLSWICEKRQTILNYYCDIGELKDLLIKSKSLKYDEQRDDIIKNIFTEILFNEKGIKFNWLDRPGDPKASRPYESMKLYRKILKLFFYSDDLDTNDKMNRLQSIAIKGKALCGVMELAVGKETESELEELIRIATDSQYKDERLDTLQHIIDIVEFEYDYMKKNSNAEIRRNIPAAYADDYIKRRDLYHRLLKEMYFTKYLDRTERDEYLKALEGVKETIYDFQNDVSHYYEIKIPRDWSCEEEGKDETKKFYDNFLGNLKKLEQEQEKE